MTLPFSSWAMRALSFGEKVKALHFQHASCGAGAIYTLSRSRHYNLLYHVLDFAPMSKCRELFIVVLLLLSLPVQAYAAVSMKCVAALTEAQVASATAEPVEEDMPEHHDDMRNMSVAAEEHHHGQSHHAHSCSTCASCCFGAGLPTILDLGVPVDDSVVATRIPSSARAASFLTDGIERPPRDFLV